MFLFLIQVVGPVLLLLVLAVRTRSGAIKALQAVTVFAYLLAYVVFALPPVPAGVVVLLAACPTGANAFLFASRYEQAVGVVSGAVALGTVLAAVTISGLLWVMG